MPRPCINEHALQPQRCPVCRWCVEPSLMGQLHRRVWQEPEPNDLAPTAVPDDPSEFHRLLREDFLRRMPPYPEGRFSGRGAVILGGGRYESSVYVTIQMLRSCGWTHPILVWYRSHEETISARVRNLPGVEVRDLRERLIEANRRTFDGWPSKMFGLIESPFEECLFLDADCYPVRNPEFCFDRLPSGLMVWPDAHGGDHLLDFVGYSVPPDGKIGINGGQYVLRKRDAWPVLQLASWFDDHADFYYLHGCGDQDAMRAALARLQFPVERVERHRDFYRSNCFVEAGPDSPEPLFVHRQSNKLASHGSFDYDPVFGADLPREIDAWAYFFDWLRRDPQTGEIPARSRIPGWLMDEEGCLLAELSRRRRVLELGRFCGLSTSYFARTAQSIDSIDRLDARIAQRELDRFGLSSACEINLLTGDFSQAPFRTYDLIFIDGAHDSASVRRDTYLALDRLAPGGVLAYHDYDSPVVCPEVRPTVDAFAAERGWKKIATVHSLAIFRTAKPH